MNPVELRRILQDAFLEDIGAGDLTSETLFPNDLQGSGIFSAKENGTIAGLSFIEKGYRLLEETISVDLYIRDGDRVEKGDKLAYVEGPVGTLLTGERVILNLLQHASGVATTTRRAVDLLDSDHTRICDTRKTLPGYRMIDKYAVRCGGGYNHRMGLYDGVILKDNHIAQTGSISRAVRVIREQQGPMVNVEVEVESVEQVREAVEAGADAIMFDNCSPDEVKDFIQEVPDEIVTEVSGGIDFETLPGYRDTDVDYVSMGMLTHSFEALDISFNVTQSSKST